MAAPETSEGLPGPADLSSEQREAVERLLFRLADDEFVLAERYTEWQVRAPTLESDLALSNMAQDELGHARLWYDLLQDFGPEESDLVWERPPGEWRHATLVELPFREGDWADAILRGYLYDTAEQFRLEALADSSYARIRDRVGKIRGEEEYHVEHGQNWLERLAEDGEEPRSSEDEDGRTRLQDALDRLFPYALTLFEPTDTFVETRIEELGVRTRTLPEMREEWLETTVPFLEALGLDVPVSADGEGIDDHLPEHVGRDTDHTDDWAALHEEFTHTYRDLGRERADRIMKDPDDVE